MRPFRCFLPSDRLTVCVFAAGAGRGVRAVPPAEPRPGRESGGEQLPLQDGRLHRLVHLRGRRQLLPMSHLCQGKLPHLQGHPPGLELPAVPGGAEDPRAERRRCQTDAGHVGGAALCTRRCAIHRGAFLEVVMGFIDCVSP